MNHPGQDRQRWLTLEQEKSRVAGKIGILETRHFRDSELVTRHFRSNRFRGCSACSLADYHKYDLFQIQVREIESTRLLRQPCSTRNKFHISLILNLLAHPEAFVYQLMWSLNSLSGVSRYGVGNFTLSLVSFMQSFKLRK